MVLIAISLLLLAAAVMVISYPLIFHELEAYELPPSAAAEFSERDALLEALSELELSHRSGKLSETDYLTQKLQLEKQYLQAVGETSKPEKS